MERDIRGFLVLALAVAGCVLLLTGMLVALVALGGPGHLLGLITAACTELAHVATDIVVALLLLVPASAVVVGMLSLAGTALRTRMLVDALGGDVVDTPRHADVLVRDLRLDGRVLIVESPDLLAFVHGYLRPRVIVSTAVLDALDGPQLRALLAHERHHVVRFDPLRMLLAGAAARALFPFPVLRDLARHFTVATEIEADRAAIHETDRPTLAATFLAFERAPRLASVVAMTADRSLDQARIRHILDPATQLPLVLGRARLVATTLTVCLGAALLAMVATLAPM
jgi:Zn-dependent protease with chaperone function